MKKQKGNIIPRSEALRLAKQILTNAEQERLSVAESEATRGIQWEGNNGHITKLAKHRGAGNPPQWEQKGAIPWVCNH